MKARMLSLQLLKEFASAPNLAYQADDVPRLKAGKAVGAIFALASRRRLQETVSNGGKLRRRLDEVAPGFVDFRFAVLRRFSLIVLKNCEKRGGTKCFARWILCDCRVTRDKVFCDQSPWFMRQKW